jgi:CDP-diacylglycerol--glycerol-3-phosphate 3-phosphatidyltransferase
VARLRNEVTEMGAVLDVALDRAVENILWITFLQLGMVPLWVPIVFLIRSFVVDGIRGVALTRGKSGFGMMHTPWGRFLVASRFMRAFYGLAKALVFCFLYLTHALALRTPGILEILQPLNQSLILLAVALCVARGIPVVLDGRLYFSKEMR